LIQFISAAHDIGKASPAFQGKQIFQNPDAQLENRIRLESAGLPVRYDLDHPNAIPHSILSQHILELRGIDRTLAVVPGGHHGMSPDDEKLYDIKNYRNHTGSENPHWNSVQDELLGYALFLSDMDIKTIRRFKISVQAQVLLTGITIMSDWIASNEKGFPYSEDNAYFVKDLCKRVSSAWEELDLPSAWEPSGDWIAGNLCKLRFGYEPRPFQSAVEEIAGKIPSPGIMVIEAPMGEGKTEAALSAAEIMVQRFGKSGLFFALPTQATADGIFERTHEWMRKAVGKYEDEDHTLFLAHGKSRFNKLYVSVQKERWNVGSYSEKERTGRGNVVAHEWLSGRKKGILSDVVVGTVDQVLMCGLKQKHLALRHLGLANKVAIIDECHAYDAYMGSYLSKALRWLGSYEVPVILLSATLPPSRRYELIQAYLGEDVKNKDASMPKWASGDSYPLITYSVNGEIFQKAPAMSGRSVEVAIKSTSDDEIVEILDNITSDGGFVGIILNTVGRAQILARSLSGRFGRDHVRLLHSRYTNIDRTTKEAEVLEILKNGDRNSKSSRMFIVGTQVMEQSLDLDFDVMVTDLCPIDLLLQRMGRLHRHVRERPDKATKATCYILDTGDGAFEKGSEMIYGKYHLMNSRRLLSHKDILCLPEEIPLLVRQAYSDEGIDMPEELQNEYLGARQKMATSIKIKESKAKAFQIKLPERTRNLVGWLYAGADDSERTAQATVRDTNGSIEVILVQKGDDGKFRIIPSVEGYGNREIPSDAIPDRGLAFTLAGCKVALPNICSYPGVIDKTIKNLEGDNLREIPSIWSESEWLNGELYLILDSDNKGRVDTLKMKYDSDFGLVMFNE
jgi:CRISPR-associated endonuclease/helicase Cas3